LDQRRIFIDAYNGDDNVSANEIRGVFIGDCKFNIAEVMRFTINNTFYNIEARINTLIIISGATTYNLVFPDGYYTET
jgi:hypothetical protein